jgi:hypothetical protein
LLDNLDCGAAGFTVSGEAVRLPKTIGPAWLMTG